MSPIGYPFGGLPMPQLPGMPGALPGLPPFMPGMSPAMGMHPYFMNMPGFPMMPPVPGMKTSSQLGKILTDISHKVKREMTKETPDMMDMPLDLSGRKKRKLDGDVSPTTMAKSPRQNVPINLAMGGNPNLSPANSPLAYGQLRVKIPQTIKVEPNTDSKISPPNPSIGLLPRTGSSAFSTYSPRDEHQSSSSDETSPKFSPARMKEASAYEHKVLQAEFLQVTQREDPGSEAHQLHQVYRREVDAIETERYTAMEMYGKGEGKEELLGSYFDHERLLRVKLYRSLLNELKAQGTPIQPSTSPASMEGLVGPGMPVPMLGVAPLTDTSRVLGDKMTTSPSKAGDHSLSPHTQPSPHSGEKDQQHRDINIEGSDSSVTEGEVQHKRRKFLSTSAVSVLNGWYEAHYDHPYPGDTVVGELATTAKITVPQVKKWMANKRVRSSNTLPYNGSIHPKKLLKIEQLKESKKPVVTSENSIVEAPNSSEKKRSKRLLEPKAVEAMNRWYCEHNAYPYPTEDEKKRLADENNLTVSQVTCWFANKRNRSHNTRKITTKKMWQKLHRKLEQ